MTTDVAVIGAGVMGRGIAYSAIAAGMSACLVDLDQSQLESARESIARDLDKGIRLGKVDPSALEDLSANLETTADLTHAVEGAPLVIEAIIEDLNKKRTLFKQIEECAPAEAVIASNTSALSITAMAEVLDDPSRAVTMHFFNPVPRMKLCELVRGEKTSEETMKRAVETAEAMGKETVEVRDSPGFATSRLNALIGNEGFRMLEEKVASPEDIDRATRLGLNHPMGPLEMADLVGLDTRLDILEHLAEHLGERFKPTEIHRRLVTQGRLGRKSGRGVYRYENGEKVDEPSDLA